MELYSNLLGTTVSIDGYLNAANQILLTHRGIKDFARGMMEQIKTCYTVISSDPDHSVVLCRASYRDITVTEMGETLKLADIYAKLPTLTAFNIAFDRAIISILGFPSNVYSVLEFGEKTLRPEPEVKNFADIPEKIEEETSPAEAKKAEMENNGNEADAAADNEKADKALEEKPPFEPASDQEGKQNDDVPSKGHSVVPEKTESEATQVSTKEEKTEKTENTVKVPDKKKTNLDDYVLNFGIFTGTGTTVRQAFERAAIDESVKATIKLYLAKDLSKVKKETNKDEYYGLMALRTFARRNGGDSNG